MGELVTPQNTDTIPTAAPKLADSPSSGATAQPKVAPTKKEGTISPPLYPALRVAPVKIIFSRKA